MKLALEGLAVLVTGASGGIGRALARAFADEGAAVVCHAHGSGNALRAWLAAQPWHERALAVEADVSDPDSIGAAVDAGIARFGRLDVCVANAGSRPARGRRLDEADEEEIRQTVAVNLLGSLWTARAFLRRLSPREDGRGTSILFVGSTAASFGEANYADYAAAKAGLFGLVATLKNEIVALDPRGRVNLVEPGWTATHVDRPELRNLDLVRRVARTMPLRQFARADDIARTALWLSSPAAARHVTGETIRVAGGMEGRLLWDAQSVDPDAIRRDASEDG